MALICKAGPANSVSIRDRGDNCNAYEGNKVVVVVEEEEGGGGC